MSKKSTKPAGANIFAGAIEGLGDSVSAFFTDDEAQQFPVALDLIDMRPQIRTELEDEDNPLPELAASIKAVGVISPIFLRRKGERYELIAGERRVRAAQMAGLDAIPAMVRDLTDQQAEDIQAAENIQRKNLTNMELARRLQKDLEQLGSIDAVMAKRNKSRSWVSKILSLNKLPEQTQRLVTEGVTADLAIISDVRQIEARDPFVAKELVDDLKRNFGKGDSREKVQRVRARIKPAANKAKAARHDLGELYAQARTGDAKAIAAARDRRGGGRAGGLRRLRQPRVRHRRRRRAAAGRFPARGGRGPVGPLPARRNPASGAVGMKLGPLDPGEFAALHLIAVRIGRLSEARIAAARLVIQEGKTYKYSAELHHVTAQAVWNTVARMNALLSAYREAKTLEAAEAGTRPKRGQPRPRTAQKKTGAP